MSVRCGIEFIDYEGRIDGESQTQLLNSIQPKEIIVVRSGLNIESYKRNLREKISSCQAGKFNARDFRPIFVRIGVIVNDKTNV